MTVGRTWVETARELGSVAPSGQNACSDSLFSSPFVFCRGLMDKQHGVLECWDQMFLLNPTSVCLVRTPHLSEGKEHKPRQRPFTSYKWLFVQVGVIMVMRENAIYSNRKCLNKTYLSPVQSKILIPTGVLNGDFAVKSYYAASGSILTKSNNVVKCNIVQQWDSHLINTIGHDVWHQVVYLCFGCSSLEEVIGSCMRRAVGSNSWAALKFFHCIWLCLFFFFGRLLQQTATKNEHTLFKTNKRQSKSTWHVEGSFPKYVASVSLMLIVVYLTENIMCLGKVDYDVTMISGATLCHFIQSARVLRYQKIWLRNLFSIVQGASTSLSCKRKAELQPKSFAWCKSLCLIT